MIQRLVKLILDPKSAKDVEVQSKEALDKGTDPKTPEKNLGRVEKAMGKLRVVALAVGAAIVGALVVGIRKVIAATSEQEKVNAQLETTLRSTANAAGRSAREIMAHANALQTLTAFSNEQIQAAQNRLLSYTEIVGENFDRATEVVLDFAQAFGMNTVAAAEAVGKALNFPTVGLTALTRQGFIFTEQQKEQIKFFEETNQLAKAQAIIFEELESVTKGQAEAYRNTLGGALQGLRNAFDDLFKVGKDNTDAVVALINRMASNLEGFGGALDKAIRAFRGWYLEMRIGLLELARLWEHLRLRSSDSIDEQLRAARFQLGVLRGTITDQAAAMREMMRLRAEQRASEARERAAAEEAERLARERAAALAEEANKAQSERIKLLIEARDLGIATADENLELLRIHLRINREIERGNLATERRIQLERERRASGDSLGLTGGRERGMDRSAMGGIQPVPFRSVEAVLGGREQWDAASGWIVTNMDAIESAGVRAGLGIADAFQSAFTAIIQESRGLGGAVSELFRGTTGAVLGMIADIASSKVMENAAAAVEAVAWGLASAARGDPRAAGFFASAKQHGVAMAAWAALAGAGGAGQRAVGGTSGGIPSGARDPIGRVADGINTKPEINIFIDPLNPANPVLQDVVFTAAGLGAERHGSNVRIHAYPQGTRR